MSVRSSGSGAPVHQATAVSKFVAAKPALQPDAVLGGSWTFLGTRPPGRDSASWVYDSRADRFILFGGSPLGLLTTNDTWAYDYSNNTWANLTRAASPSPRAASAMVYDSRADRVILFGGLDSGFKALGDTWVFDYANRTWTNVTKAYAPASRGGAMMAYDPVADKAILVGGYPVYSQTVDTWAYDYATDTWTFLTPAGSPPERFYASMVYDPVDRTSLVFGGETISGSAAVALNDTYTYDYSGNVWVQVLPVGSPPARAGAGMAYDAGVQRTILFGGANGPAASNIRNDTWAYNSTLHSWANLTPTVSPAPRVDLGLAYDAKAGRVVMFGGTLATGSTSDEAWSYEFGAALPTAPRNLAATGGASKVTLTWVVPPSDGGSAVTNYTLYRGTASGGETLLTMIGPVLTYTDTAVTAGTTYYYQVAAVTVVGAGPRSNEASATPTTPDTTPPLISISFPANGTTLAAVNVTVVGTASDDVAVRKVEVSADGTSWILAIGTTTWTANLTLPDGADKIYARATDTSGNHATIQISVTVKLPSNGTQQGLSTEAWILLVALAILVTVVAAALVVRRGRKRSQPELMPPPTATQPTPEVPPEPPTGPPRSP